MKIWKLNFELDLYDNLMPVNKISIDELQTFDGRSKKDNWRAIKVKRMEPEKSLELSNAPGFYWHIPVFDKRAVDVLNKYLINTSEILLLKNEERDFYAINIIKILDCIDYENSEYKMFKDGKKIMRFKKYVFKQNAINDIHFFKIKDEPIGRPFVTDSFRNSVLDAGLTGFKFQLVWDSEVE